MAEELPADISRWIAELERIERGFGDLIETLSETQFNWQPEGGRSWSVGQCIDHLARGNEEYLAPLGEALDRAAARGWSRRGPLAPGPFGRWFIGQLEPPPKRRLPAPRPLVPASRNPKEATWERFRGEQARMVAFARHAAAYDLNRVRLRNPFLLRLPLFNVASGLLVIAAHERRHLLQAERVAARPEFPRA